MILSDKKHEKYSNISYRDFLKDVSQHFGKNNCIFLFAVRVIQAMTAAPNWKRRRTPRTYKTLKISLG
jgi:hypothetical protein